MEVSLFAGLVFTALVVLASIGGLQIARTWLAHTDIKSQHDITDPYSQFVAMLFAVLLGFMVADSMQRFSEARQTVQTEASSLGDVYRISEGFTDTECKKIRLLCLNYAKDVASVEWPLLAKKQDSVSARNIYRSLWHECVTFEPSSERQTNAQEAILTSMQTLGGARRMRIEALHSGLPAVLWAVLILGGIATIIFTYFFSADDFKIQVVMVAMVSLVICLNLFLLASYDDPFSGDVKLSPSAFETQIRMFEEEGTK